MGKTPELGFGIMRLPQNSGGIDWKSAEQIIEEYMKGKFCYFDLHPAYMNGKAQDILRKLVVSKYPREEYLVANKMPYYGIRSYDDYERIFSAELAACGVDYFDYYILHAVARDVYGMHECFGGFDFLKAIKKTGNAKYIGISFHDNAEVLENILQKHSEIDFVQLQINFMDWEDSLIQSKKCHEIARKYKKKIIVMEPIKGGTLASEIKLDGKTLSSAILAQMSLEFVASLPGIDVILSGMSDVEQVRENRSTLLNADGEIDKEFYKKLTSLLGKRDKIRCTACRYCERECPQNIVIPDIIALLNSRHSLNGNGRTVSGESVALYSGVVYKKGKASDCIRCGTCEGRCPQKNSIV